VVGGSFPSYDANGNVTNDFLHAYAWDANGRPVTADGVGLTYDALGNMVEQNRSGANTQIVYAPSGGKLSLMSGSTLQKGFVPLTGGSMAVYNSSGLAYYRHSDWVGSSRFASTSTSPTSMYSDVAYAPFGEGYAQTGTTDLSFTGMNQDTVPNLHDFPAREYGIQGRWPSPDPAGILAVDPTDPQTWNRYAYVRNNPLAITDPTGLCGEYSSQGDASCGPSGDDPGPCFITSCWEPIPGDVYLGPITIFSSSAPATRGLPSGFLATGPGIDYSWLGLLNWALGLPDACSPQFGLSSPCIMDANDPLAGLSQATGIGPDPSPFNFYRQQCAEEGLQAGVNDLLSVDTLIAGFESYIHGSLKPLEAQLFSAGTATAASEKVADYVGGTRRAQKAIKWLTEGAVSANKVGRLARLAGKLLGAVGLGLSANTGYDAYNTCMNR
jgi:RHS repeat-associated protein